MGDGTVIIGYNKGPCQVSSILVREDQVGGALALQSMKRDSAQDVLVASAPYRSHLQSTLDRK